MNNYLYKTRGTLIDSDLLVYLLGIVFGWIIHFGVGLIVLALFLFRIISILSMRVYIYRDRVEYKTGFIIKTFTKSMPLSNVTMVSYSSDLLGKIFNYGDIIIGTYNSYDSFVLKGLKNAKMLSENIKSLMYEK